MLTGTLSVSTARTCKLSIDTIDVVCDAPHAHGVVLGLVYVCELHHLQGIGVAVSRPAREAPEVHKVLCRGVLSQSKNQPADQQRDCSVSMLRASIRWKRSRRRSTQRKVGAAGDRPVLGALACRAQALQASSQASCCAGLGALLLATLLDVVVVTRQGLLRRDCL